MVIVGGGAGLIGLVFALLLTAYFYRVLYYFLYGSNAYFEMQRYGNVDFIVHVVDESGNDISTPTKVIAWSVDAFAKKERNEPVYPGFDVRWDKEEFEYELAKVIDQYGNEESSKFNLQSSAESPEKWKKAVPPPGMWSFVVEAIGYETTIYHLEIETFQGECYSLTIPIKEH